MPGREEAKEVLLEILGQGLLRIRTSGWAARNDECAHEADHLHNLPKVISDGTARSVLYYYNVERPAYIKMAPQGSRPETYEPFGSASG